MEFSLPFFVLDEDWFERLIGFPILQDLGAIVASIW